MNRDMQSKPRYEALDGLRGVAALVVLVYHHFELSGRWDVTTMPVNHGYLAVDFFFILSGFVVGYAYDDRWGRMTTWQFFKRRLVRLHPMIIFATLLCMATFYFGLSGDFFPMIKDTGVGQLLLLGLLSMLMIPALPSMDIRGWTETNPVNGNAWTLYFEYFANIAYALVIRRFPRWLLTLFVCATAVLTLDLTLDLNLFGMLDGRTAEAYTVIGGWSMTPDQLYIGFSRLLFPFFAGLLLSRCSASLNHLNPLNHLNFTIVSLILIIVLVFPRLGGAEHFVSNGIYEAVSILVLFPVIVWIGSRAHIGKREQRICRWLGDISYPLYVTHYAIVFNIVAPWCKTHADISDSQLLFVNLASFVCSILVADAAMRLFDIPVRSWLKNKLLKQQQTL